MPQKIWEENEVITSDKMNALETVAQEVKDARATSATLVDRIDNMVVVGNNIPVDDNKVWLNTANEQQEVNVLTIEDLSTLFRIDSNSLIITTDENANEDIKYSTIITPQMFGAIGDGFIDDTAAFTNALNYIGARIKLRPSGVKLPSQYISSYKFYVPSGIYKLTAPLEIPCGVVMYGDGAHSTILKFSNSAYGLSLKGYPYNGKTTFFGSIRDLAIDMDGTGIGISNVKLAIDANNPNYVENTIIDNVNITYCSIGMIFQGIWDCAITNTNIFNTYYGIILDDGYWSGGCNNIHLNNIAIISTVNCGLWCAGRGVLANNIDVESIGATWRNSNETYATHDQTIRAGNTYTTSEPCAIYITKKARATFNSPWFERIQPIANTNINSYAFLCENLETFSSTVLTPQASLTINQPFFNTDVTIALKVDGPITMVVDKPFQHLQTNSMFAICNNLGGHSTCVFRNINIALVNKITVNQKVSYKAFIFENVIGVGSEGRYNNYYSSALSTGGLVKKELYVDASNSGHDCKYTTVYSINPDYIEKSVNNSPFMHIYYGEGVQGKIGLPSNVGTVTVNANATEVDIACVNNQNNYFISFIADNEAAARTINGGYYINQVTNNTIKVTFLNAFTNNATLHYFIMTA